MNDNLIEDNFRKLREQFGDEYDEFEPILLQSKTFS
jgi:hypothetical protein